MEEKMIYCGNCGKALPIGTKFCPDCGTALPEYVQDMTQEMNSVDTDMGMEQGTGGQGSRRLPSWLKWVIIAAVIVVAAIIVIVVVVSPGKIKLDKYIVFEESGVDGYGTVDCYFDENAFEMDYGSKIEFSESEYAFIFDLSTPAEMFCDMCVDYEVVYPTGKENGSLSNGDKVELKWECDDATAKSYFNEKMKYSDMSYTVKGLSDTDTTGDTAGTNNITTTTGNVGEDANTSEKVEESPDTNITSDVADANSVTSNTGNVGEDANTSEEAEKSVAATAEKNAQETASAESAGSSDYLCSYSSDRLLTKSDVDSIRSAGNYGSLPAGESLEQMIVNEIYARHGYRFTNQDIQDYFEQKDWYNAIGTYNNDMDAIHDQFSDVEQENVDYLSTLF